MKNNSNTFDKLIDCEIVCIKGYKANLCNKNLTNKSLENIEYNLKDIKIILLNILHNLKNWNFKCYQLGEYNLNELIETCNLWICVCEKLISICQIRKELNK